MYWTTPSQREYQEFTTLVVGEELTEGVTAKWKRNTITFAKMQK